MSDPLEHPAVAKVRAALAERGATGRIKAFVEPVKTAAAAAAALDCEVGAIANSLIFDADGAPVLILTSGAHRVNTEAVAERIGVSALRRAKPDFVKQHTGQVIGGVAPVGHPAPVATYLDAALRAYPVIWAAGGVGETVFPSTFDELLAITGATEINVE